MYLCENKKGVDFLKCIKYIIMMVGKWQKLGNTGLDDL